MLYTVTNTGLTNGRPTQIGANTITIANRAAHVFTLANFTTETIPTYSDPEGDALAFIKIQSLPTLGMLFLDGVLVTIGQLITSGNLSAGKLTYDGPDQDGTSTTTFKFDVADVGSSSLSGLNDGIITINAGEIPNEKPDVVGNYTVLLEYAASHTFSGNEFTTSTTPAYNDPEGDAPYKIKVLDLPVSGTLVHNGSNVLVNQEILISEINSGYMVYNPDLGIVTNVILTFNFAVSDTVNGGFTQ